MMKQSISRWVWVWFLRVSCIAACGCGGSGEGGTGGSGGTGGGGATGGSEGALQVVETDPMDMATDMSRDTTVRAMFSHALQETTVTTASFTVRRSDGPEVGGAVTVTTEGDTALFMPDGAPGASDRVHGHRDDGNREPHG